MGFAALLLRDDPFDEVLKAQDPEEEDEADDAVDGRPEEDGVEHAGREDGREDVVRRVGEEGHGPVGEGDVVEAGDDHR